MVAGLREGQIGKQPGRPLRVSAPSHFWLCKEAVERLCYNNRKIERETVKKKQKTLSFFFSHCRVFCGPSLKENAAWYEIFQFIRENMGESILYLWVEKIREFLVEKSWSTDAGEAGRMNGWQTFTLSSCCDSGLNFYWLVLLPISPEPVRAGILKGAILFQFLNLSLCSWTPDPTMNHPKKWDGIFI